MSGDRLGGEVRMIFQGPEELWLSAFSLYLRHWDGAELRRVKFSAQPQSEPRVLGKGRYLYAWLLRA